MINKYKKEPICIQIIKLFIDDFSYINVIQGSG